MARDTPFAFKAKGGQSDVILQRTLSLIEEYHGQVL
eukprot:gene523-11871_t